MSTHPLQYIGYSRRATALFIDGIWWTTLTASLEYCTGLSMLDADGLTSLLNAGPIALMLAIQASPFVATWALWLYGNTPGKWLLGLRIVDADTGEPMSARQATLRIVGYVLCFVTCGIGFLPALFTRRKQGLHDLMANTVVVGSLVIEEAVFPRHASSPGVARLGAKSGKSRVRLPRLPD